ncbi:TetR/AcrR family transcriptional regulator [soil metagenome]
MNKETTTSSLKSAPRSRGRPKLISDDLQRSLIVEVARRLFIERGYGRTTTDDVAALCKISKQKLYRLFPGKTALFAAVVDAHRHSMLALPGNYDSMPADTALEQIFQIDIDPVVERERMSLLRLVTQEARQYPELEALLRSHGIDRSRTELAKWLSTQHRRGQILIDNAERTAQILMDMIFGPLTFGVDDGMKKQTAAQRRSHVRRCIAIFLNGVAVR